MRKKCSSNEFDIPCRLGDVDLVLSKPLTQELREMILSSDSTKVLSRKLREKGIIITDLIYQNIAELGMLKGYGFLNADSWKHIYPQEFYDKSMSVKDACAKINDPDRKTYRFFSRVSTEFREFIGNKDVYSYDIRGRKLKSRRDVPKSVLFCFRTGEGNYREIIEDEGFSVKYFFNLDEFRFIPTIGLVQADDFESFFPEDVLLFKLPVSNWLRLIGVSDSLIKDFFIKSDKFAAWYRSEDYVKSSRAFNQSKGKEHFIVEGYEKLLNRCSKNDVTLLISKEEYQGMKDCKGKGYKVRCNKCGTEYLINVQTEDRITLCPKCKQQECRSYREKSIQLWIESKKLPHEVFFNYKGFQSPETNRAFELDMYIPDLKVAFEFNGYAYHHTGGFAQKSKNYHAMKTETCLKEGIKLYHLWERFSDGLCKSIIASKLGLNKRVYARKLSLKEIPAKIGNIFFEYNHADGTVRCSKYYALVSTEIRTKFYVEEEGKRYYILCCLSLLNRRIQSRHTNAWELGRFATQRGYTIVGGYTTLLKEAVKHLKALGVEEVMSYCNRDLSPDPTQTFYAKQGFDYLGESGSIYKYWASKATEYRGVEYHVGDVINRQHFQKQKLLQYYKEMGLDLPEPCTEQTLAASLGFYPVYNSGNFKYRLKI